MIEVGNLKRGDKIKRIQHGGSAYNFIVGKEYEVFVTAGGYPYVREETGTKYDSDSLEANAEYWEHVEEHKFIGLVVINDITLECSYDKQEFTVVVTTDREGMASLRALEAESSEALRKERLIHDIKATEDKLATMRAELSNI